MTNKEKWLQQVKKVDANILKKTECFKLIYGIAFNGREFDNDFLREVDKEYKEKGISDFKEQFSNYINETEQKEREVAKNVTKVIDDRLEKNRPRETKTTTQNGVIVQEPKLANLNPITANELDKKDIAPIEWLVNEILPIGLLLLSAPPKNFKSYMALQLCTEICLGGKFLNFNCHKHACLYLDLESTERRPKNRLNQILGKDTPKPDNLYIVTGEREVKRIGNGFETQIKQQLEEHPNIKLIIVDVYQLIALPKKGGQNAYDKDYESLRALKKIVDTYDVGIMLIHHNRKMKDGSDVFNEVSGSIAMTGSMDATWIIQKDRKSKEATLNITGRDLEQRELKINFNTNTYKWEYLGTAEDIEQQRKQQEYEQSPIVKTVKKLLKTHNGQWQGSASDLKKSSELMNGCEIHEKVEQIGKFINGNEHLLLLYDKIKLNSRRTNKCKVYIFTDTTNTTNTADTTNTTNTQQELDI